MVFSSSDVVGVLNSFINQSGQTRTAKPELTADDFLSLLVTQMQYQDPLSPMDQQDFLGQLAQFNSLQQSVQLNEYFQHFMQFQELTQATSLIGKDIVALVTGSDGNVYSAEGTVKEVYFTSSGAYLKLEDGAEVALQDVVNVKSPEG
jgi:flagellar basal-body rod modification protein FlgD